MNAGLYAEQKQSEILHRDSTIGDAANFDPTIAGWALIAVFAGLTAVSLISGAAANFLRLAFPVGAFAVGVVLYFRFPRPYLYFAWWMWFLTPLVRRLIDYRSDWVDPSPVLLAPFLVAIVTVCNLTKRDSQLVRRDYLPFLLAVTGVVYALGIGLIQNPISSVAPMLLNWLVPVLFGFHFFSNWRDYPETSRITQSCFLWMTLLTGAYGVYQFVAAPAWDALWLSNVASSSFGKPEALEIRVFSTMNSPGPFGVVMMAGLLLLFTGKNWLRLPAAIAGFLSLLLSLARASWVGWAVGFAALFKSLNSRERFRVFAVSAFVALCLIPMTFHEPFVESIGVRFQTLTNPQEDASAKARFAGYFEAAERISNDPIGSGFGGKTEFSTTEDDTAIAQRDSGFIDILLTFGWIGGAIYFAGVFFLFIALLQRRSDSEVDRFAVAARAVGFALFAQFFFGSVMIAVSGVCFWSFCGFWMAAQQYHSFAVEPFENEN